LPCSPQSFAWSGKFWRDSASKSPIVRNPSHGLARGDCRRCVDDRRRAYVMDSHGGLTPPALGCTRVCASQKSSFHRHTFAPANRSGGRQPAVGGGNAFARAIPQTCWGPWPVCRRTSLQSRSRNHGGLTPPALVLLHECASAGDLRFPLHARNLTTGG
jgi:hypothetical protein